MHGKTSIRVAEECQLARWKQIYGRKEKCVQKFGEENWKRHDLKDLGVDNSLMLKYMDRMGSAEFILLGIEGSGMLLWKRYWTFRLRISRFWDTVRLRLVAGYRCYGQPICSIFKCQFWCSCGRASFTMKWFVRPTWCNNYDYDIILTSLLQCWKPYAAIYGLALLKMGTTVPETCWATGLLINHNCCIKLVSQIISSAKFGKNMDLMGCDETS